mgnify:CR=1 FL=1
MVSQSRFRAGRGFPVHWLLGFAILILLAGCIATEIDDRSRASSYGVDDPLMSALVIRDDSTGFDVQSAALKGVETSDEYNWGALAENQEKSYEIKPGKYTLYIGYYDQRSMFECKGSAVGEVNAEAGLAVGFSLTNGSVSGCTMMYDPPTAVNITSELKKPESPDVTKSINWAGTLCIVIPVFMVLLAGTAVAFLLLRKKKPA